MINKKSLEACAKSRIGPFVKPLYDSYNFSKIPNTVISLLTNETIATLPEDTFIRDDYDFVIVLLIDSFGWDYFEKFAPKYPFLQRFIDCGIVSKITSQFPSTTTNHVTCMHTGLSVGQSGIYEWFYYEPLVDSCICPLHFSYALDKQFNTLARAGIRPKELFPFQTIYEKLKQEGVSSFAFQEKESARSPFSESMYAQAEVSGFKNLHEGLSQLTHKLNGRKTKSYYFFYIGDIDAKGHEYGPDSVEVANEIDKCFTKLEEFWQQLNVKKEKGCLVVTADHGMAAVDPEKTFF